MSFGSFPKGGVGEAEQEADGDSYNSLWSPGLPGIPMCLPAHVHLQRLLGKSQPSQRGNSEFE